MSSLRVLVGILLGTCLCSTTVRAQGRTDEASEASITDPVQECTAYDYAPVSAQAASFPQIWVPATLLPNDATALAKWNSIMPTIPTDVQVKAGSSTGDFSNVTPTYPTDDPDCWWTYSTCTTPKHPNIPPDVIDVPEPRTLGYGFDDGPNCSHNVFYDFLSEQKQKATMYFIGSNAMDWPLEAQRAVADGHEICCHTWSHHYMTTLSSEDAFAELYYTNLAIKLITGYTPTCWRPPFGDVDDRIRAIATGLGMRTIVWKYDTFDWEAGTDNVTDADVDSNYMNIINLAQNGTFNERGTIVLFHELTNFTMSEAVKFYPQLKAAFDHIVPVGVAYNITQPYVETNYSQPTFDQYVGGTLITNASTSASASNSSASSGTSAAITQSTTSPKSSSAQGLLQLNALWDGGRLLLLGITTALAGAIF